MDALRSAVVVEHGADLGHRPRRRRRPLPGRRRDRPDRRRRPDPRHPGRWRMQEAGRLKNDTVVATVMSNLGFVQAMQAAGITVEQTRVGDRYVLEAMQAGGFSLGGEQSGPRGDAGARDHRRRRADRSAPDEPDGRDRASAGRPGRGDGRLPQVLVNVPGRGQEPGRHRPGAAGGGGGGGERARRVRPGAAAAVGHRVAGPGDGRGRDRTRRPTRSPTGWPTWSSPRWPSERAGGRPLGAASGAQAADTDAQHGEYADRRSRRIDRDDQREHGGAQGAEEAELEGGARRRCGPAAGAMPSDSRVLDDPQADGDPAPGRSQGDAGQLRPWR